MRRILPWAKTMGVVWALDPKVKVTAIPKLFDGRQCAARRMPDDRSRACIR